MKPSRFSLITQFLGLTLACCLGIALVTTQVSVSSPDVITPQALAAQLATAPAPVILDVRSAAEYAAGHIPGALNIPYRDIPARLDELTDFQSQKVIVYCEVGVRAGIAKLALEQAGFESVLQLQGDIRAWREAGLPIAIPSPEPVP